MKRLVGVAGVVAAFGLIYGCGGGAPVKATGTPAAGTVAARAAAASQPPAEMMPVQERMRDPNMAAVAVITTERGTIKFVLMDQKAPLSVANFIKLADKGFYNGLAFHRVEPRMLIQGGDPKGDGTGGPGYSIKGEFTANNVPNDLTHIASAVGMARTQDPDSAGSQFYICTVNLHMLDGKYAVFGYVIEGMDVVSSIQKGDKMREIKIEEMAKDKVPAWVPK